ncbi:MAG: M23 family metallopeptidase [Bacteroidales bacterium]|nr:M23 family metallopeptidase [Bacteroidales bacterium]
MAKRIFYRYNPVTDNFERYYPSVRTRLLGWLRIFILALSLAGVFYILMFYIFDAPTEKNLRRENEQLRSQYSVLNRRMESALRVMSDIQNRDDNFYRVMMQMDPIGKGQRLAGLDNEKRYRPLATLSDADLVTRLTRNMDLLDRQLYAQSISFDELRSYAGREKDKLAHIPSVLPINMAEYTMSSGYGYRRDPLYGSVKFHEGLDFAADTGTPVYATADGKVEVADRQKEYGNCVEIAHGYNYMTRYAHLSEILVQEGQAVKRGELIGRVGSTGKSTGPHLHYEVRFKGEPQNPVNYYFMDLTPDQYAEIIQAAENAGHVMD